MVDFRELAVFQTGLKFRRLGAMHDRDACLMANHGLVAGGATLARAMKVAQEIESLCEGYLKALAKKFGEEV